MTKTKKKSTVPEPYVLNLVPFILDISTVEGSLVFDPFGGSGTTYVAAHLKNRKWIGIEAGSCEPIIDRFNDLSKDIELMLNI